MHMSASMAYKSDAKPHCLTLTRALGMIADAGLSCATETLLLHGRTAVTGAGLVRAGFATVTTERKRAGGARFLSAGCAEACGPDGRGKPHELY